MVQIHSPRPLFWNQRLMSHENWKSVWSETKRSCLMSVGCVCHSFRRYDVLPRSRWSPSSKEDYAKSLNAATRRASSGSR